MSTRSQIEFSVKGEYLNRRTGKVVKYNDGKVLIYRHSDGYPDKDGYGVIPSLKEFFKWNAGRNDLEYMTANFILFEKLSMIAHSNQWAKNDSTYGRIQTIESILKSNKDSNANWLVGYGICQVGDIHGDIEYFYNVEVKHSENDTTVLVKVRRSPKGKIIEKHEIKV